MRRRRYILAFLLLAVRAHAGVVPGVVQAEDYDAGGEGVAYHDTTPGNTGGLYRSDDVDIESNGAGNFTVSYIAAGEWLQYTVTATNSFQAQVRYKVAQDPGAAGLYAFRLSLDGQTKDVQNGYSGCGWHCFNDLTTPLPFAVEAGVHTVRVDFIHGNFNLDELSFLVVTNAMLPYQDPGQSISNRVDDLMGRMTRDEKIGQTCLIGVEFLSNDGHIADYRLGGLLNGGGAGHVLLPNNTPQAWTDLTDRYQAYALATPLHIPMIYGVDAVHGHNNVYGTTIFPHNIGLGATRNPLLVERIGQATAAEVKATGMHWAYAPAVSVARDARWGRYYEAFSETPELSGELGAAAIRGLQGSTLNSPTSVLACAKHFAGDGGTAFGSGIYFGILDQGDTQLDEATFRRLHVAPYSNAVAAGVMSIMASYSSWNGTKMHAHHYLLTDVLKGEMGFQGFIVSDWLGVEKVNPGNPAQALVDCMNAGIDMVMVPQNYSVYRDDMRFALQNNNIASNRLDDAVRRILRVKFMLGLFDRPYADRRLLAAVGGPEHRQIAREAVRESLVVLKNSNSLLPLRKDLTRIHVAGKAADNLGYQCGGWTILWQGGSGNITLGTTIYQAITQTVSAATQVTFSQDGSGATGADVGIVVVGETPYAEHVGDTTNLTMDAADLAAIDSVRQAGVPVVVVLVSGRPLIVEPHLTNWDALVAAWLPGSEGLGVADVLFGDYYPQGRSPRSWPRSYAQLPLNIGDTNYDPLFAFDYRQPIEPALHLVATANGVAAAWPDGSTGFVAQSTTSLVGTVTWTPTPGDPVRTDGWYRVVLPAGPDALLYRLLRP